MNQWEIKNDATENEEDDVEDFNLGLIDDGSYHQVHSRHQHDYRDDNWDLQMQNINVKFNAILSYVGLNNPDICEEGFVD